MKPIPQRRKASSEMLPLMDMIFLLLVIFIFMIVQMRPNFGVNVELPDIGKNELIRQNKKPTSIVVSVTDDSKIFVNKDSCSIGDLMQKIEALTAGKDKNDVSIILRGDKQANYGQMIKLFTLFRTNQISEVLFDVAQ